MSKTMKILLGILFIEVLLISTFWFAGYVQENQYIKDLVQSFGYFGILLSSFVLGLNLIVPLPSTIFIPVFTTAGFSIIAIIIFTVIGATIADLISFYMGTLAKGHVDKYDNKIVHFLKGCCKEKRSATLLVVFTYSIIAPFPNEFILLPLGSLGFKLRHLIVPFVLGTIVHVSVVAYGVSTIVELVY